ncbi:MAG: phosphodiester glycosidase family protein [Desulfovibrio sp.]|nr:phosphodiester glycosidase family protein [Desulfovibrio sp.]
MNFIYRTPPCALPTASGMRPSLQPLFFLWLAVLIFCSLPAMCFAASEEPVDFTASDMDDMDDADALPDSLSLIGEDGPPPGWRNLEPGLQFGEFQLEDRAARLTVLRIDPGHFDFVLCARSQHGGLGRTLRQWSEEHNLTAAINASMYLPDGSTSTGYMRQDEHINNGRLVRRFGAFFVAGPADPSLPAARILEKGTPQWREQLDKYRLVVQNYRMISADRRILWSPGGPLYSISAVAEDGAGQILFLHCRRPIEAHSLARQLLQLPLDVRTVMYVEGGGQAGLLIRSPALTHEEGGLSLGDLLITGNLRATLPNVLGVRRKKPAPAQCGTPESSKKTLLPSAILSE